MSYNGGCPGPRPFLPALQGAAGRREATLKIFGTLTNRRAQTGVANSSQRHAPLSERDTLSEFSARYLRLRRKILQART